ncbi:HNH/ENDO VII family nuclease [Clostridium estertheticum]|uniref:HNH/ENDO VII family nuclease n=1 Tax=Clostridium estertheticum TaxID=238834 RepID=UPI001CF1FD39|nr:HNH/ENDO VII family nuclease [Clostridium estertheticum]MCB2355554.1 HNH/ENDO VII family nuclease [Clostridium estertheticum]
MAAFGAGAVIGAALIGAALGAACNAYGTIASDIKNNKMSSPLDYLISAAKGALVGALCGAMFGPTMPGTSLFAAETTGQLALNFVKTLFIGGAENSTYYALNELANFRMPNLGEQLNKFKNGVLFTGLFMGGAKALETAAPWIKKGASKVIGNIEKNVNKFGKYIDDLVPAKAVTPDGQTVYIKNGPMKSGGGEKKVELNKQQKDYNKAVEKVKSGKLSAKEVELKWLSDNYKDVEIEGTVKVNGEVRDISRRVYQTDINWDYMPKDINAKGLTNKELALKGKSPYAVDKNGIEAKIELHHLVQIEAGSMVEIVATTHDEFTKILHGLVESGGSFRNNVTLDKQYSNFLKKYWRWRSKNM